MADSPLKCPHCQKSFAGANDRWQHARAKHKGKKIADLRPRPADDPSMGELVAEAHWNPDPALDWVREMFDVQHPGRAL